MTKSIIIGDHEDLIAYCYTYALDTREQAEIMADIVADRDDRPRYGDDWGPYLNAISSSAWTRIVRDALTIDAEIKLEFQRTSRA